MDREGHADHHSHSTGTDRRTAAGTRQPGISIPRRDKEYFLLRQPVSGVARGPEQPRDLSAIADPAVNSSNPPMDRHPSGMAFLFLDKFRTKSYTTFSNY